ncbi:NYN domain-containing protein [candidate division KSB1 bacterium]
MLCRACAYIDGFNVYYGAVKETPYKWLDLYKLSEYLLPAMSTLKYVKYFTAKVKEMGDKSRPIRQEKYWNALEALYGKDRFRIIRGNFTVKNKVFRISKQQWDTESAFVKNKATKNSIWVMKSEEKGSDVNAGVNLVIDAFQDEFDYALVISNDTDLTTAVEYVKKNLSKKVYLASPLIWGKKSVHVKLKMACTKTVEFDQQDLMELQLPNTIPNTTISKPPDWDKSGFRA